MPFGKITSFGRESFLNDLIQRRKAVLNAVAQVPYGHVATYGQIAQLAGLPGRARFVGRTLAESSDDVPWHRIVRADGRIAIRPYGIQAQIELLQKEGVVIEDGKVDLARFQLRWIE